VTECLPALRSLHTLFLDCGSRDEFNLQFGARMLHETLEAEGVPHLHEEFDDGHMNISYRYERSLSVLGRAMG
jgi:enterochelin esterase family protein